MSDTKGMLHPLTLVTNDIVSIFKDMGFSVELGPEMETEEYNFDRLNFAKDHPARDMQDTFFIKNHSGTVLRTHTSNVQARFMEALTKSGKKPPLAIVVPGKVFRNEATDATHEMQFFQCEGLVVGKDISVAHMKGVLSEFFKRFFGEETNIRLRPSYFPFVEPGFEVDVEHKGKWIEVLGAGLVHPNVLRAAGIDPEEYSGFAFGMGIDRFAVLRYAISDIRLLYQGDLRLNQF
jgi:phenylalanyl-tRNA synthetase alpha chain